MPKYRFSTMIFREISFSDPIRFVRPRVFEHATTLSDVTNASDPSYDVSICAFLLCTYLSAAAAEHGCCAAAVASRRRELRLMTDVAESCAPFPLQLHHAHLLSLPLPLTNTDSTTVLDAHVFSPLHEFGASCPFPEITSGKTPSKYAFIQNYRDTCGKELSNVIIFLSTISESVHMMSYVSYHSLG